MIYNIVIKHEREVTYMTEMFKGIENVRLSDDGKSLVIIDQTLLPGKREFLTLSTREDLWDAIYKLRVRGAPAIGIFAAYAIYILSLKTHAESFDTFYSEFKENKEYLDSSRPTAVNLRKMLNRMDDKVVSLQDLSIPEILDGMKTEAEKIQQEDVEICTSIAEYGLELVKDGYGILTHCNAGPLATSKYGTALAPILLGTERGMKFSVYADETRPLLQGARLTSYELTSAGVDCTLICDNMASIVMKEGRINACFVGCDRVAANGDAANKIGTSGVAILAKYYGIPFYVFCPSTTIDMNCETGDDIKIELRNPDEIKSLHYEKPMAPDDVKCYNPAFDVTENSLITAIVTEKGIIKPPYRENLRKFFENERV